MIVFAGPSVAGLAQPLPDGIEMRPPVQQGDVYLATLEQPDAIGLIDGYFEGAPSVWHKEILWAMTQGITVLGASSMGALRAAELDCFGMIGVGKVYQDFRDGALEDDDEVALLHGPAEVGYPGLSLAMCNLRATLEAAQQARVVTGQEVADLTAVAKAQFYKARTWTSVLEHGDGAALSAERLGILRDWVRDNEIDQKQIDAQRLLTCMAEGAFDPPQPTFHFEETFLWQAAVQIWQQRARPAPQVTRSKGGLSFLDE